MSLSRRKFLELTGSAAAAALATEMFGLPEQIGRASCRERV